MTTDVTIEGTFGKAGKPLEELSRLIALREKYIGKESTKNATTATALNVVTSLKGLTRVAPYKANEAIPETAYEIKESHTLYPGFVIERGKRREDAKVCLRTRPNNAGPRSHIKPVMLISPSARNALKAKVYVVTTANRHDRFAQNVNAPAMCWYILAYNIDSVKRWVDGNGAAMPRYGVRRLFAKEGGMAKYTLAKAQAKIYDKPGGEQVREAGGAKQWQMAAEAAQITVGGNGINSGEFSIEVFDALNYSLLALKGGQGAMDTAIMKAANKTAGILNAYFSKHGLEVEEIPTPFPEIAGK